ncbi:MAG TPA: flagellar biosynthetic protein FliR [Bryobacteraceae bacterium]
MPIEVHFGASYIAGFLLTIVRVGSALFMLPLPGFKDAQKTVRVVLIVSIAFCLFPSWPVLTSHETSGAQFALAGLAEVAAGLLIGLAIALLHESFQFAAQAISVQTGFSFASITDPTSKADTGVFLFLTQLTTGLLFFTFGVYHYMLRLLARSFEIFPLDTNALQKASLEALIHMAASMFATGLKLGLPMVILLMLIDLAVALLSRLHAQLQLVTLTFPVKTALSFVFLAAMMARWPSLYEEMARRMFETLAHLGSF